MSTMIFASEWTKGSKRARQHVDTWQTQLQRVGRLCETIARQQKQQHERTRQHMHERQAAKPHYTQLHMLQLTLFESNLAEHMRCLRKEAEAEEAAAAVAAAKKRHWCF